MPYDVRPKGHDEKAPDGFICNGWRLIYKGGYVKFGRNKHYHTKFKEWTGKWVFVEASDWLALRVSVWPHKPWENWTDKIECIPESEFLKNKA